MQDERGGRPMVSRWLDQAGYDLENARFCALHGRYALACFLAQQSAEKTLVGYLYARGAESIWGHALADLCEEALAFDPGFDALKSTASLLDKFYYLSRYPSALPGGVPSEAFDELDASRAIEVASEVTSFVEARLEHGMA